MYCETFVKQFHFACNDSIIFVVVLQNVIGSCRLLLEMGRMSDYDIRPKPKVWAGSPNFGRMLCARMKQRFLLVSALSGQKMS